LRAVSITLPNHRAAYADPALAEIVGQVLAAEGLVLNDLKARILKRAYLPKGKRSLLLQPAEVVCGAAQKDELFPESQALSLSFTLPPGAFATLVLNRLGLVDGERGKSR
jgi:tRNA pseudouridine13 synthase